MRERNWPWPAAGDAAQALAGDPGATTARVAVVSVVLPWSRGAPDRLEAMCESLARGRRRPDLHVVVAAEPGPGRRRRLGAVPAWGLPRAVVTVASDATPQDALAAGVAEAVAAGAEVLVLLDAGWLAGADLVATYAEAVCGSPDLVWCGPVVDLPAPPPGGYPLDRLDSLVEPLLDDPDPAATVEQVCAVHRDTWAATWAATWSRRLDAPHGWAVQARAYRHAPAPALA